MARPLKDKRLLMRSSIRIPLTDEQKKLLEDAAHLDQSDLAAWVRPVLLKAAEERLSRAKQKGAAS